MDVQQKIAVMHQNVDSNQPDWVCHDCGEQYGVRGIGLATFHDGLCGVCHVLGAVTEPRDFGYLKEGWQKHLWNLHGKDY